MALSGRQSCASEESLNHPSPLLTIRVSEVDLNPPLTAACPGYEAGRWRASELARHCLEWLPEFALKSSEWEAIGHADAVRKLAEAAQLVYATPKYQNRGEFGEILLHILLRQEMGTTPAISKIYFKDSRNDTVKGFDAVHVSGQPGDLELWLGEVKFYTDLAAATRDVVQELEVHSGTDYLRAEFTAIANKLDEAWEHTAELRRLLDRQRSLDDVFSAICIPVLLTYDSAAVGSHNAVTEAFQTAFRNEVLRGRDGFAEKLGKVPLPYRVHLFLLPMKSKSELVHEMDSGLRHAQELI